MDKQAREAREQMKQLKGKEKWTNFWYYYRIHVIVGLFAAFLIIFTAVECAKRIDYDLSISYYSAVPISEEGIEKLTEELKKNIEDINTNGQVDLFIAPCFADPSQMSEQTQAMMMKLSAELAAGDAMGYLVDDVYKEMLEKGYSECFEKYTDITDVPIIKECFALPEGKRVYWAVKNVYENEKDKPERVLSHENAVKLQQYFDKELNK